MTIKFIQSVADYKLAISYLNKRILEETKWRFLAKFSGFALGFLFVIGLLSVLDFYKKHEFLDTSILTTGLSATLGGLLVFIVGIKISSSKVTQRIFSPIGINSNDIGIEIDDIFLVLTQNGNLHKYRWDNFLKLEKTEHQIYLFLEPAVAVYIPAHAFESELEFETSFRTMDEYFGKTQ